MVEIDPKYKLGDNSGDLQYIMSYLRRMILCSGRERRSYLVQQLELVEDLYNERLRSERAAHKEVTALPNFGMF